MNDKDVTYVISDLHVGGGPSDPGDDHIYHKEQLATWVDGLRGSSEGQRGAIELIINGDFLEFPQTNHAAHAKVGRKYWCSEEESLQKLRTIVQGHPAIFAALKRFQEKGNALTIAAGNHDVDLYWPEVQRHIRTNAGAATAFETGNVWYERYSGKLQISHGHMDDPANRFRNWKEPFVAAPEGGRRLEMCPGTLFMVRFVNALEQRYPFADNLQPISVLIKVLAMQDKRGFVAVVWLFLKLLGRADHQTLEGTPAHDVGARVLTLLQSDAAFGRALARLSDRPIEDLRARITSQELVAELMLDLLATKDFEDWTKVFEPDAASLGPNDGNTLEALRRASLIDGKEQLRQLARLRRKETGADLVVMGHTHLPDDFPIDGGRYFNPGSWTRYWDIRPGESVRLEQLRDEKQFPYKLQCVRVERINGSLSARLECIEACP